MSTKQKRIGNGNKTISKINPKTLKRLLSYITKYYKKQFIIVIICIILSAVASVSGSLFLQTLIDNYITPLLSTPNPVFTDLFKAICSLGLIYVVGIISTYIYNRTMAIVSQGVLKTIRDEMFSKMQTFPIRYFDTNTHGDIMSHYTNDADTLREMISRSLPQLITSFVSIIAIFCSMLYVSVPLTIFVLFFVFLMLQVTRKVAGRSSTYFVAQQKSLGKVNGYIEEMMNGQKVIKVFTHEEKAKEGFDKINEELCDSMTKANKYANVLMPALNNLGNVEYALVAIIGGFLAISGTAPLTVGGIASFLQLSKNFNQPIMQVSQQLNLVIMALAGAERIFELMDQEPEEDNGNVTLVNANIDENGNITEADHKTHKWAWKIPNEDGTCKYVELKGHVELENVTFSYDKEEVLHNISLYAKPGQKIAFVGATGAGKTTITNLINRFYEIKSGKITYDGIDIKDIKKADLRNSLGMVLQDTNLFTGTIKDNIKYVTDNATDEDVIKAAKIANADEFIRRLPNGYDTMISGNGSNLSQGQRQLLSIARAAINDPPVMILDEATSSIDTRTEKIVQDGMDKLMEGRTVFVIAHRLSTVRNSKAIMVMDHGRIIERGEHDVLIAQKGVYYQLYTGAFELE